MDTLAILNRAMNDAYCELFAWISFSHLGDDEAVIERDLAGYLIGGSYFYATPRTWHVLAICT